MEHKLDADQRAEAELVLSRIDEDPDAFAYELVFFRHRADNFECEMGKGLTRIAVLERELAEARARLAESTRIASNALYFGDNGSYRETLYDICRASGMDEEAIGEKYKEQPKGGEVAGE